MTDDELKEKVLDYRVYARVNPEHKLRIVKAIRAREMVVAMTGDGVNDAPSIKAANIGIGMGISGTEVTKGAADVILTDDNFATIVSAVKEGRRTYSNILKIVIYLVALSLAELILLTSLIIIFDLPFFNPILILWVNVVTDTFPAIAMGALPAEKDVMSQKPNPSKKSLFRGRTGLSILVYAAYQVALVLVVYLVSYFALGYSYDPRIPITMSYVVLGTVETVHPFNLIHNRKSIVKSKPFISKLLNFAVFTTMLLVIGSVMLPIPAFQNVLGITSLSATQWAFAIGMGLAIIPLTEIYKFVMRRIDAKKSKLELR